MRYVRGVHGELTNIPAVIDDVLAFIRDEPLSRPTSPADALAAHLAIAEVIAPALIGAPLYRPGGRAGVSGTDGVDLWDETPPPRERIDELIAQLDSGQLPEFRAIRLL